MTAEKLILVVDDDPALRELLTGYLSTQGFRVRAVADGGAMRAELARERHDLVILDLMLPNDDGLALCRDLRATSAMPIIMLTARGDEVDRIVGLEMGADDYLPKPFNPRELLARIKSILRRAQETGAVSAPTRQLRFANWTLDMGAHHLVSAEGIVTPLSSGEFRLLRALAENAQCVMSRDQLLDAVAEREGGPFDRTIDVLVSRLRRRLGDDAREPELIKTVRSEGYMLAAKIERQP